MCLTTSTNYQTSDDESLTGSQGDIYLATTVNYQYGVYEELKDMGPCLEPEYEQSLALWPTNDGIATSLYTEGHIVNVLIPGLIDNIASLDPQTDSLAYQTATDQLSVWEQAIAMNAEIKMEAEDLNTHDFSGGTSFEYSQEVSTSVIKSIETNMYIDQSVAVEVNAEVGGAGAGGTAKISTRTESGSSEVDEYQSTNNIGFTLADNDIDDHFEVVVKSDKVFGTHVFVLNENDTQSSCPYEGGYQIDQPYVEFADNSQEATLTDIPNGEDGTFLANLCNESSYDRTYHLKVDQATNLDGLIIEAFGSNLAFTDEGVALDIDGVSWLEDAAITVSQTDEDILDYEGIVLYLYSLCSEEVGQVIESVIVLNAHFNASNSISELNPFASSIQVFPNPNQGEFQIRINSSIEQSTLEIRDLAGRLFYSTVVKAETELFTINEENLAAGLYTLQIANDKQFASKKIIIK
jgi:hypothetical protein